VFKNGTTRALKVALPALLAALLVLVWWAAVRWTRTKVFPAPLDVVAGVGELVRRGVLLRYVLDSLLRVGAGFGIALAAGVPAGLVLGLSRRGFAAVNPVVQILRPISPIAWIPIAIVLFGVGGVTTVFLIVLASLFPIITATIDAVHQVPAIYLRAGRNFGLSRLALFRRVLFPASVPRILVGLRIALGIAWLVVVAAEMVAVDSGLGYLIIDARNAGKRYDLVVAGMLLIGLIGLALDLLVRRLERLRSVRWGLRAR